jgi:hypothetical protein
MVEVGVSAGRFNSLCVLAAECVERLFTALFLCAI